MALDWVKNPFDLFGWPVKALTGQTVTEHVSGLANSYTGARDQANIEENWKREDTAITRMVEDAENAGINPMALVGSGMGAPTSTAPSTQGRQEAVSDALSIAQFDRQMALMDAQTKDIHAGVKLKEAQVDKTVADTGVAAANREATLIANEAARLLNPERLRALVLSNERGEIENRIAAVNEILADLKVDQATLDLVRSAISRDLEQLRVDNYERELAVKEAAAALSLAHARQLTWDTDWFEDHLLPTSIGFDTATRIMFVLDASARAELGKELEDLDAEDAKVQAIRDAAVEAQNDPANAWLTDVLGEDWALRMLEGNQGQDERDERRREIEEKLR